MLYNKNMGNSRYGDVSQQPGPSPIPVLQYISHSKYEQDWLSQVHSHPFTELAFIVNGNGMLLLESKQYSVSGGALVIVPPNRQHTEISSTQNPLEYYFLGVKNFIIENTRDGTDRADAGFCPVVELSGSWSIFSDIFSDIFKEMKIRPLGYELVVQGLLLKLSGLIIRKTGWKLSFAKTEEMSRGCAVIKEYIDNHYADKISLDDLAEISCISKYHLIHEFSRYIGMPPIEYQLKRRIQESKYLLTFTEMSVADVAFSLGFSSIGHFSRRFKQEVLCSPLQFRKQSRVNGTIS